MWSSQGHRQPVGSECVSTCSGRLGSSRWDLHVEFLRVQAASQSVVSVCQHTLTGSVSKAFYKVAAELSCSADTCLSWVRGTLDQVYLGILKRVFGVRYAVCVLVIDTF